MKILSQRWHARGSQILTTGPVQQTIQIDPQQNHRRTFHPTTALIAHVGTDELAHHIVSLHNRFLDETNASQEIHGS